MALIQKALLRHNLKGWFRARRWCFIVGMCPELAGLVSRASMVLYCWDVSRPFNTSAPRVAMDSRASRGVRLQDAEESATKRQRASERKRASIR
jgi:hypothetical protein